MKHKTLIAGLLMGGLLLSACGPAATPPEVRFPDYTYERETGDGTFVTFAGPDAGLNRFLNGYLERHMRYNENAIHNYPIGAGSVPWKEWEAMTVSWWDASAVNIPYDAAGYVRRFVAAPDMDRLGYVWMDSGVNDNWGIGWEFPTYEDSKGKSRGFNFERGAEGWTMACDATDATCVASKASGLTVRSNTADAGEIVFEFPDGLGVSAFHSPLLDLEITLQTGGDPTLVEDLLVCYKTAADDEYSPDKTVSFREKGLSAVDCGKVLEGTTGARIYFPMYLEEKWGREESTEITGLKLVLRAREGQKGKLNFSAKHIRFNYDARQINNCADYLIAARQMLEFSQDTELLAQAIGPARRAFTFLYETMNGKSGLVDNAYFVGHDGVRGVGHGIGDGYWDILSFPAVNLYCNLFWYKSVEAMRYLEDLCARYGVQSDPPTVDSGDMAKRVVYDQTEESLTALLSRCRERIRTTFWNEETGRFHAGTVNGRTVDNGYLMFNVEAVELGLCTKEQEVQIMAWINGDRLIEDDWSTGEDLYFARFAPRVTTRKNAVDYVWQWGGSPFGEQVQDGGTVMQTSYYDLKARAQTLGADNAFDRLKAIQTWYEEVEAAGGSGWDFYRAYYTNRPGLTLQGGDSTGALGLDYEFLEASVLAAAVPRAFFGLRSERAGVLTVEPRMPAALDAWKIENLSFNQTYYDLSVGRFFVRVDGLRGQPAQSGAELEVRLEVPPVPYRVLVDGSPAEYAVADGRIVVRVPFGACKVESVRA